LSQKFSVIDTGIGIAEDKQDKIFEHSHRRTANTTRLYGGTGLGAFISARLVELMDSTILIDSKAGWDSDFISPCPFNVELFIEPETPTLKSTIRSNDSFREQAYSTGGRLIRSMPISPAGLSPAGSR